MRHMAIARGQLPACAARSPRGEARVAEGDAGVEQQGAGQAQGGLLGLPLSGEHVRLLGQQLGVPGLTAQ